MGLTLITGPARSGKTASAVERLIEYSPIDLAKKARYVVPTKEAARRIEIRLAAKLGVSGLLGNVACTFFSFTSEFIAHEGLASRMISDERKELTLRRLIENSSLEYLKSSSEFPGFIRALDQTIGELKLSLVRPDEFGRAVKSSGGNAARESLEKLSELAVLYKGYQEEVLRSDLNLYDREGLMWLALEEAEAGRGPEVSLTVFDGFDEMNAVQRKFVEILAGQGRDVVLILDYEPGRPDVFSPSGDIRDFALGLGATETVLRPAAPSSLDLARGRLFQASAAVGEIDGIAVIEGCDPMMEVELVGEEIQRLAVLDGYSLSDILITARDPAAYRDRIIDIFRSAGIPVDAGKTPLAQNALIKTVTDCLAAVRKNWPRDEVLRVIKSGAFQDEGRDSPAACEVEIAVKGAGVIGGREIWQQEKWVKNERIRDFLEKTLSSLSNFDKEIRKARSARKMADAVRGLIEKMAPRAYKGEVAAKDLDLALAEDGAAAARLDALLGELERTIAPGASLNYRDFFNYLEEIIRLSDFAAPASHFDAVELAPVTALGARDYRAVFVLGMLEKVFPKPPREEAFLRDDERRALNGPLGGRLGFRVEGSAEKERFLFYRALAAARERIYLSYPLTGSDAKDRLPSYYVDEIRRLTAKPRIIRRDHIHLVPGPEQVFGPAALKRAAVFALAKGEAAETEIRIYNALVERDRNFFAEVWRKSTERQGALTDENILKTLSERAKRWSCSELETFAVCPFKYFIEKTLGLERIRDEVDPLDIGSLLHEVLNKLFRELLAESGKGLRVGELDPGSVIERALTILDECLRRQPRMARLAPYDRETLAHELKTILDRYLRSEIKEVRPGFVPAYFELEFGRGPREFDDRDPASTDDPYVIKTETESIEMAGRIDRVDIKADGAAAALVIDYKSGSRDDLREYVDGTKIQPLIYAAAMEQLYGTAPAGAEYRPLRQWKPDGFYAKGSGILSAKRGRILPEAEYRRMMEECDGVVAGLVREIKSGRIGVEPLDCPDYCHLLGVCRYEKGGGDGIQ